MITVLVIVAIWPLSASGWGAPDISGPPEFSFADTNTTWRVLDNTYKWLGQVRSGESGVDPCAAYSEARDLLEAMVILHQYYPALGDESETLVELNGLIAQTCPRPQDAKLLGNSGVFYVPPQESNPTVPGLGGGGIGPCKELAASGGGIVCRINELPLAYLYMTANQRSGFRKTLSPETGGTLDAWLSQNAAVAKAIAVRTGGALGFETPLPAFGQRLHAPQFLRNPGN